MEIENNILKEQLEDYEPAEDRKEENRYRMKEITQKNKTLETISKKKDRVPNQLKGDLVEYKEKIQKASEEAEYKKIAISGSLNSDGKLSIQSNMNDWHLISDNVLKCMYHLI